MDLIKKILKEAEDEHNLAIYFNWSCNALVGLNPVGADNYLKQNLLVIKKVASSLLKKINYTPKEIYRGIIVQEKLKDNILPPHQNFTYISFSEDKKIAYSFSNPGPDGFGSLYDLGKYGYIISYMPKIEEIIFHYEFLKMLPYVKTLAKTGIDGSEMLKQKEVTILQPSKPFTNLIEYTNFK